MSASSTTGENQVTLGFLLMEQVLFSKIVDNDNYKIGSAPLHFCAVKYLDLICLDIEMC